MKAVVFEAMREAYGMGDLRDAITVGELVNLLLDCDPDAKFVLSHDRGFTYGSIHEYDMEVIEDEEE